MTNNAFRIDRRRLLPVLAAPLLVGCWGNSVTRRFRVIATAEVDGRKVEGSSVMEVTYAKVGKSLMGAGGSATLKGEALILDLPGKGTVSVLPVFENNNGSLAQFYEGEILQLLGIPGGPGVINDEDLKNCVAPAAASPSRAFYFRAVGHFQAS